MGIRILLVEDDPKYSGMASLLLSTYGYEIETAETGEMALAAVRKKFPDAVLLDIMLPDINGIEVCRQLRAMPGMELTPIIMLTGLNQITDKRRGFEAGADDYMTKPFDGDDLKKRILAHLNRVNRISFEDEIIFKEIRPASRWQRSNVSGRSDGILAAFRTGPRVSIVIPTLNEAENLPDILPWIPDWVSEVVLVDGYSTDGTVEMALSLLPDIKIVMQKGQGKGSALRQGFAAATGDIIVMLDADGSTSPSEIPAFVGALLGGADFAKGSRFLQGGGTSDMPFYRRLGNFVFVMLIRLLFGGTYSDLLYGYNAFWAHVLPQIQVDVDGFEIETLMNIRALRAGVKITEVPSFEAARQHGIPKLRAIPDGWRVLKTILRQYYQHRVRREQMNQRGVEAENRVFVRTVGELFREALHLWRSREHLEEGYYIKALDSIRLTYQGLLAANFSHPEDTALQHYYRSHYGDAPPWAFAEETSIPTTSSVLQIPVKAWERDLAELDDQSTP